VGQAALSTVVVEAAVDEQLAMQNEDFIVQVQKQR
jgi:hypothetical protein